MIDHFTQGAQTPAIAYAVSVTGSFVGLMFAVRARRGAGASHWTWLSLSAVCLGATAVWSMHFIAMTGFDVAGTPLRYDPVLTVASGLLAVLVMGVALHLTINLRASWSLPAGGAIAGTGIVAMHYMGMASINMRGHMGHDPLYVVLAAAIALVAATASLWFALRLRGVLAILAASAVMGVAVCCMHYTGMFGVHVTMDQTASTAPVPGSTSSELLLPLLIGQFVFLLACSLLLMLGADATGAGGARAERQEDASAPSEEDAPAHPARHRSDDVWSRRN